MEFDIVYACECLYERLPSSRNKANVYSHEDCLHNQFESFRFPRECLIQSSSLLACSNSFQISRLVAWFVNQSNDILILLQCFAIWFCVKCHGRLNALIFMELLVLDFDYSALNLNVSGMFVFSPLTELPLLLINSACWFREMIYYRLLNILHWLREYPMCYIGDFWIR